MGPGGESGAGRVAGGSGGGLAVASGQGEEEEESLKCVGRVSEGVRVRTPQGG